MSGTESSDSLVHLRDSVYYLSVLITRLQKKTPRADETTNPQDVRAASGTAQRRTLKHLTACLSRGSKDEESRVVAVTLGPVDAEGVKVAVMGRSSWSLPLLPAANKELAAHPLAAHRPQRFLPPPPRQLAFPEKTARMGRKTLKERRDREMTSF
jgi:hypothetical protein